MKIMKKIILMMIFIAVFCSCSYGVANDDVYVRKDVFEVEMKNINLKLDGILSELKAQREELKAQREELKAHGEEIKTLAKSVAVLAERVDGNYKNLDARMNDLRNGLYLGLVLFAAVLILPFFNKWWDAKEERKQAPAQTFTLDDVKRLIAEAKLGGMPRV